jgi:hypothetical protein
MRHEDWQRSQGKRWRLIAIWVVRAANTDSVTGCCESSSDGAEYAIEMNMSLRQICSFCEQELGWTQTISESIYYGVRYGQKAMMIRYGIPAT